MKAPDLQYAGSYAAVVFDLDGTLARTVWPARREIGEPIAEGIALLVHYADLGLPIVIYTSRPQRDEPYVWAWIEEHGLPVDRVVCEKPLGCAYFDDKAYRPEWT